MIALRKLVSKNSINLYRNFATAGKLVEVTQDDKTGFSILSMARAPVNSLNLELLEALKTSLEEAQENRRKGVILTSSLPIFSAGLDLMEMYKPDLKRAEAFWNMLQDTWITLYGLEIPVAAAINGASPAGGCLLATSCEYRVMVEGKHTIGLNETQLGFIAPQWFRDVYIRTIGYRQAEMALLHGTLFSPEQALKLNLIDEIAKDKTDAIAKCGNYISSFAKISGQARAITKFQLRKQLITELEENREQDTDQFVTFLQMPQVQAGLHKYMEGLKQK